MNLTSLQLQKALELAWTRETSSLPDEWSESLPSRGQCVPSALVAQHYLGGELQKLTTIFEGRVESHYRNVLQDGSIFDSTRSQYPSDQPLCIEEVELDTFGSVREKRLSDPATARRYEILKSRVENLVY